MTNGRNTRPQNKRWVYIFVGFIFAISFFFSYLFMNASQPGKKATGCWQGCTSAEGENDGRFLRILSLNMLHGYPKFHYLPQRTDWIVTEIRRLDADIVVLQEVPNSREHGDTTAYLAQQTAMNHVYFRANGNRKLIGFEEGALILSRFPLHDIHFVELDPQAGFFEHRIVLHAVAATSQGNLDVYVTHLTGSDFVANEVQIDALLAYVEETAVHTAVIAGDFNAVENTSQIKNLSENWIDSYRTFHPNNPGLTCCINKVMNGSPDSFYERVDYVFVAPNDADTIIHDVQLVLERPFPTPDGSLWASDHIGLLVTLELMAEQ